MIKKISVILAILIVSSYAFQDDAKNDIPGISVEQVKAKIDSLEQILLLDVRTCEEYDGTMGHIEGSMLIPLYELEDRLAELDEYQNREIIVICRSGNSSGIGTQILIENGYKALNMAGGMIAWNNMLEDKKKDVK